MFDEIIWEVGQEIGEAREGMVAVPVHESKVLEGAVDGCNVVTR